MALRLMPLTTTCPRIVMLSKALRVELRELDDLAALHLRPVVGEHQLAVDAVALFAHPIDRPVDAGVVAARGLQRGAHLVGVERVGAPDRFAEQEYRVVEGRHERVDDALAVFLLVLRPEPASGGRIPVEDIVGHEPFGGGAGDLHDLVDGGPPIWWTWPRKPAWRICLSMRPASPGALPSNSKASTFCAIMRRMSGVNSLVPRSNRSTVVSKPCLR